jgi:iron complex outermembrane receptor protein
MPSFNNFNGKILSPKMKFRRSALSVSIALCLVPTYGAAQDDENEQGVTDKEVLEIITVGARRTFSAMSTTQSMSNQQSPITSILSTIDNLPGVNITEGDTFGFDDWSTTVNLRGYQTSLAEQQVGTTIDGFPNGDSNYGGGAKANRYIDTMNSGSVEVNQGIASIDTRTTESLGGTLNFTTNNPLETERLRMQVVQGDFESQRYYGRYDTGRIFNDSTVAWVSLNHNEATDWVEGSAENERDHFAAKFITDINANYRLTGYYAYDDVQEDNYQRVTTAEFAEDSDSDRLIGTFTDVPFINQLYRRAWSTVRENRFGYLKLDGSLDNGFEFSLGLYDHQMEGRGDWVPPQIVDLVDDAGGAEFEVGGNLPILGGTPIGNIYFVNASGEALSPEPGCVSSITFPYGGAGPQADPLCYGSGAIPLQSYRHTHYSRDRTGWTADFDWTASFGEIENTLSGGIWLEDSERLESRDWHKLTDARVGIEYDEVPYWIQYDRDFNRETQMIYLQDEIRFGELVVTIGLREFDVDNDEIDVFGVAAPESLSSNTDTLFSGGANYALPVDGLEMFFGYSENVKPLLDTILEREGTSTSNLEAEQAKNLELGLRYTSSNLNASAVLFQNEFNNRLEFFGQQLAGNIPDYTIGLAGRFDNVGGIDSSGLELAVNYEFNDNWSVYGSYTDTDATYVGTGLGAAADASVGVVPGRQVVNTPDNMWVLSLDWSRNTYFAGLSTKYVGDRFIDRANTLPTDAYTVSDLYLGVDGEAVSDFLQGFEFRIVVNNLFDESYLGGISGFGAWIGAPRTASFAMTVDF